MSAALVAAQRVTDLVRLAVNAGAADNESRNAALAAAKLIAQHGLLVIEPARLQAPASAPWRPPPPRRDSEAARRIENRFAGSCRACGGFVGVGERVWWRPGRGVSHFACGDQW